MNSLQKIQYNFNRFANCYNNNAIIQQKIAMRLFSRFDAINPQNTPILELGSGTGLLTKLLLNKYTKNNIVVTDFSNNALRLNPHHNTLCLDSHNLAFKPNSFAVVMSNLMMQWCDIEVVMTQTQKVLQDDGLFMFSTFGPQTLIELRQSWKKVDNKQHTNTFIDMHDIGDKLLSFGFSGVVVESETIILTYEKVMDLLFDLKNIGAQNINSNVTSKSSLKQMIKNYEQFRLNGKLPASYEVIYAHGFRKSINLM